MDGGMCGVDSTDKALMSPENLMIIPMEYHHHYNNSSSLFSDDDYPPPPHHHHQTTMLPVFGSSAVHYYNSAVVTSDQDQESVSINNNNNNNNDDDVAASLMSSSEMKAKIASHPSFPKLLHAYIDCQKFGAPPEIVHMLDEIMMREKQHFTTQQHQLQYAAVSSFCCVDPQLDHFMESYCEILVKYKSDLSRPFDEATSFLHKLQTQFFHLCNDDVSPCSDEELGKEGDTDNIKNEELTSKSRDEGQLKEKLVRMYGSHISSLRHEFSKKKKKGKLPKEAKQTLLQWWNLHCKWPYPTECDKIALAESTGLDHKQINNWFINQRKRHWKSPENMQLAVFDNLSPHFFLQD
ncbi:hypothetical protein ABFS83_12G119600 [Erythranthe nasuta]